MLSRDQSLEALERSSPTLPGLAGRKGVALCDLWGIYAVQTIDHTAKAQGVPVDDTDFSVAPDVEQVAAKSCVAKMRRFIA